jgi:starch synthase
VQVGLSTAKPNNKSERQTGDALPPHQRCTGNIFPLETVKRIVTVSSKFPSDRGKRPHSAVQTDIESASAPAPQTSSSGPTTSPGEQPPTKRDPAKVEPKGAERERLPGPATVEAVVRPDKPSESPVRAAPALFEPDARSGRSASPRPSAAPEAGSLPPAADKTPPLAPPSPLRGPSAEPESLPPPALEDPPPRSSPVVGRSRVVERSLPAEPSPPIERIPAHEAEVEAREALPEPPVAEPPAPPEPEVVHFEHTPEPDNAPHPEWYEPVYRIPSMFIVQITPELAPVAKVGGLGDVVFGLSRELELRGNSVEIILPKYDAMRYDHIWGLCPTFQDLWVPWYEGAIHCTVYFGFVHGRKCFFIEPHSRDNFFNRGSIYGFNDDVLRFAFFSRAAIEFLWQSGKHPEIIHCHDWQTGLVPVYLYEMYQHMGMRHPRVCFTIHNFQHQGLHGPEILRATGLHRPEYFFHYDRLRDNKIPTALNLTKAGVVYSNFVTTVSPRHAGEAKDQGQGFGLEPTLHTHHMKYGGVVNGVDYATWNPEIDPYIPVRYNVDSIDGKYDNKRALRHRFLLADNEKPIVAFIGRLDPQKGLELVRHAIFYTLRQGGQYLLLGSSPDHRIQHEFWGAKRHLNDNPDVHLEIGYDEEAAHLIYAGADMILVPSRFEPCGLTQLIAMRYGTIPVVRDVGGLGDTVFDKDHSHRALHERNGYIFRDYNNQGLESALGRAIACYYSYPEHFRELMKNAMRYDYSWNHPGGHYLNIYDYIREK